MTCDSEAFERNVEAAKRLSASVVGVRTAFPEFDDRKFAEHLFCLSLNMLDASEPFTADAAEKLKVSVDQYFAVRERVRLIAMSLEEGV